MIFGVSGALPALLLLTPHHDVEDADEAEIGGLVDLRANVSQVTGESVVTVAEDAVQMDGETFRIPYPELLLYIRVVDRDEVGPLACTELVHRHGTELLPAQRPEEIIPESLEACELILGEVLEAQIRPDLPQKRSDLVGTSGRSQSLKSVSSAIASCPPALSFSVFRETRSSEVMTFLMSSLSPPPPSRWNQEPEYSGPLCSSWRM